MKTKSFIAGALLAAGLLFWIGWTVANGNFNTNQFNATYPYVNIKSGVQLTNVLGTGPWTLYYSNSASVNALTILVQSTNQAEQPIGLFLRNTNDVVGGQGYPNEIYFTRQTGTTNDWRAYSQWLDHAGIQTRLSGVNAQGVFIDYDSRSGAHWIWHEPMVNPYPWEAGPQSGNTYLNGVGQGGVVIGREAPNSSSTNIGTAGLFVQSGGVANPTTLFSATSNGMTSFAAQFVGRSLATLITPSNGNSAWAYATDIVTTTTLPGVGGMVQWDPSTNAWRTMGGVIATTDMTNFQFLAIEAGLNMEYKYGYYRFNPWYYANAVDTRRSFTASGAGAGQVVQGSASVLGSVVEFTGGTTATGSETWVGAVIPAFSFSDGYPDMLLTGGAYAFSALATGTDTYWWLRGIAQSVSVGLTNSPGCGFLYDRFNVNQISTSGLSASWTNNFIAYTVSTNGSATYFDTLCPVPSSVGTMVRTYGALSTNSFTFLTNGVLCGTITTTLPMVGVALHQKLVMKNTASAAGPIYVYETAVAESLRHPVVAYP